MEPTELNEDAICLVIDEVKRTKSVATGLRLVAAKYGFADQFDLSLVCGEVFQNSISGLDRQIIWNWSFVDGDLGLTDAQLDDHLPHLIEDAISRSQV